MVGIAVLQVNLCVVSAPRILALLVLGANGKGGYSGGYSGGGLASKATRVWQGLGSMDVLAGCPWIIFYWGCFRCFLPGNVLSQVAQFLCFFFFLNPFCQIVLHRQLWEFKSGQRVCCFGSCFASSSWNSQDIQGFSRQQLATGEALVVTGVMTNRAAFGSYELGIVDIFPSTWNQTICKFGPETCDTDINW